MSERTNSLTELGWRPFFAQQLSPAESRSTTPVRVFSLNRHLVEAVGAAGPCQFALPPAWLRWPVEALPTVGDWLLLDGDGLPLRILQRFSLFRRMASGREARVQLMAANVDTLFIVTSCNADFNLSRLERYLAMALDAGVAPVLVLTKVDLHDDFAVFCAEAGALHHGLPVLAIDARDARGLDLLRPWCRVGATVALVGSSGVGKSTLVNTLSRAMVQATGTTRAGDAKGRHTTTARSLHLLPGGGLLLDSPGLRELQLSDCEAGLATLFDEIAAVARDCRFSNCRHQGEAGCAVRAAADRNQLDPRRLDNYLKLQAEQLQMTGTLAQKQRRTKSPGRPPRRQPRRPRDEDATEGG